MGEASRNPSIFVGAIWRIALRSPPTTTELVRAGRPREINGRVFLLESLDHTTNGHGVAANGWNAGAVHEGQPPNLRGSHFEATGGWAGLPDALEAAYAGHTLNILDGNVTIRTSNDTPRRRYLNRERCPYMPDNSNNQNQPGNDNNQNQGGNNFPPPGNNPGDNDNNLDGKTAGMSRVVAVATIRKTRT